MESKPGMSSMPAKNPFKISGTENGDYVIVVLHSIAISYSSSMENLVTSQTLPKSEQNP